MNSSAILSGAILAKDLNLQRTATDAMNLELKEILKFLERPELLALTSKSSPLVSKLLPEVIFELSVPTPNWKKIHGSLDEPLEELRKWALSQLLTISIDN